MVDLEIQNAVDLLNGVLWGTCFLGLCLLGIMICLIKKMVDRVNLNKYRSKKTAFADLLNYASEPADGVVVLKNGALMACFEYEGQDDAMLTADERELMSDRLNSLFAPLDSGWALHIDAIRSPLPQYFKAQDSFFPNKVSCAIDQQRRNFFESHGTMYSSKFVLTVTWLPPLVTSRKFAEKMFVGNDTNKSDLEKTQDLLSEFEKKVKSIQANLEIIFKKVKRLKTHVEYDELDRPVTYDDLLSWLSFCLTGEWEKIKLPDTPVHLDALLAQDFQSGIVPIIGNKYIKVISIEGLVGATSAGMLNVLSQMGGTYRWNTRFIAMERFDAEGHMKKLRRFWKQKERGFIAQIFNLPSSNINRDAVTMVEEADQALAEIQHGMISYGYLTDNIVLLNESKEEVDQETALIVKFLKSAGLKPRVEDLNAVESFLGTLPAHCHENIRRPLISTMNLADIMPVYTPWIGSDKAQCNFQGYANAPALCYCVTGASLNSPFRLNLHVGDLGHTMILGPTGSGKSTLLCTLASQAQRYKGMTVISFDKGLSMYTLCKACNGKHFIPAGSNTLSFCPLGSIKTNEDLAWASNWLQAVVELNNVVITPAVVNEIDSTLKNMLRTAEENPDFKLSISNFITQSQNEDIRSALATYSSDSSIGSLLDADVDSLDEFASMNVIEIEPLMNLGDKYCLPVLLYLFHRIEMGLKGQPCMLFLDEAWIMLGHPVFKEKIREWLKVLRKKNCAVILATQSLSDAQNSGILDVLNESCPSKIFLPNPSASQEEVRKMYKGMGLNDAQIDIIATGQQKRDYYYSSANNSREFQLALDKFQLAFVGVSDPKTLETVKTFEIKYGSKWVDEWLNFNHLTYPKGLNPTMYEDHQ